MGELDREPKQKDTRGQDREVKRDILASMEHDLRTPLNAIVGFSQLGLSSTSYEEALDYINKIYVSAHYMQNLLNDCMDMNSIGSGKMKLFMKPCNYEELVSCVRAELQEKAEKKHQTLTFTEYAINRRRVLFDIQHLRQVLVSMVENAIKYTPEGGTIECVTEALIPMNGFLPVHFLVKDNGIGMSQEFIDQRLFHEFEREADEEDQEAGSGLSLYIAKHLVELMNGTIQCESTKGEGTIFHVSFLAKIVEDEVQPVELIEEDDAILGGKRILICEDHEINAILAERMLAKKNMLYEWAKDGKVGVEMYQSHESGYYDAIIMDVKMPIMNGIEATKKIRSAGKADSALLPIIAMTANTDPEDIEACMDAGMNEYLPKPIDTKQVYILLTKLLK